MSGGQHSLFGDTAPSPASVEGILLQRIRDILFAVGDLARCGARDGNGCGTQIIWVRHKNGKAVPYSLDGQIHFKDCPNRQNFKKGV